MNNYHYIVASLPAISRDWSFTDRDFSSFMEEITSQCSSKDITMIEFLEKGFKEENLNEEFYKEALSHRNRFVREYFTFDLNIRNAKVKYLNKALGRPAGKDVMNLGGEEFEESPRIEAVLKGSDILERERGIDDLMWAKIDELTTFDYFDIECILGFIAKLHIIDRWYTLDEQSGREMFKKLVDEVRGTFKGVEFDSENTTKTNK